MSVTHQPLVLRIDDYADAGTVAWLTIDEPRRGNALSSAVMQAFIGQIADLADQPRLRAVVLTGSGERVFVAGADIYEMAELAGADEAARFIGLVHQTCDSVRRLPVPVIARINGHAFGAGLELAAACDLRIAVAEAEFGMPEVRLGMPSVVEAALLPLLIGWGRARQLLLTGESIDAAQAERWGLVETVVPRAALDQVISRRLAAILAAGPTAVRRQKALIRRWEMLPLAEAIAAGIEAFAAAWSEDEAKRLTGDFVARRRIC